MKYSPSPSSSSSYSLSAKSLIKRRETLFKKAYELSTLCEIQVCVIHYGPDGELKTWPENREKVKDMALKYIRLDESKRRKKSVNLYGSLKNKYTNVLKHPISDHYSQDQISQLIQSLELAYKTLQERLRFVEAKQKQKETNLTQSMNPNSQFSLFMYNHEDATLSQIPLSAASSLYQSAASTNCSAVQESGSKNQLMHQNNNFQHLSVSNTQGYSGTLQESMNNFELNQLMQHEIYGYDQFSYGQMLGNTTSFPQDSFPDMSTSYDESNLLQTCTLPSLSTIPNSYLVSENPSFL